jgi:endonuclease G
MPTAHADQPRQLCFAQFALLHSGATKTPVWSAEHLTPARVTKAARLARKNAFHAEKRLPKGERAAMADYKGAGYDRGHMAPNADMPDKTSQRDSFSLANMVPQHPCNNQGVWASIEDAVRGLVREDGDVYVVTGPLYAEGPHKAIGRGVAVPDEVFKAIFVPKRKAAGVYVTANAPGMAWRAISLAELAALADLEAFPTLDADVKATAMALPPPGKAKFTCRKGPKP